MGGMNAYLQNSFYFWMKLKGSEYWAGNRYLSMKYVYAGIEVKYGEGCPFI